MTPAPAPQTAVIRASEVYTHAAKQCSGRGVAVSRDQARIALGAISNLYCLYSLDFPGHGTLTVRNLASDVAAPLHAVSTEVRKAVPGLSAESAKVLLAALSDSLDHAFSQQRCSEARLAGFGVLRRLPGQPSAYTLDLELPLNQFLQNILDSGQENLALY